MTELPVSELPAYLGELEDELMALDPSSDAMLLSEIDGFLTAIVLNPEPIASEAWLPMVWTGGEDDGLAPAFESADHEKRVENLVIQHRDRLDELLRHRPEDYGPVFDVDEGKDDILWEIWIDGFERGLKYHPESWTRLAKEDNKASEAFGFLTVLGALNRGDSGLPKDRCDELTAMAPSMIPLLVLVVNAWRLGTLSDFDDLDDLDLDDLDAGDDDDIDWDAPDKDGLKQLEASLFRTTAAAPSNVPASSIKIGRNDPCPCGSGKKYKLCCGRN
jgi:uncharacterized protein